MSGTPFQSLKHPHLPPDRVQVSLLRPRSQPALWQLAQAYRDEDPDFAQALSARLLELGYVPPVPRPQPEVVAFVRTGLVLHPELER